MRRLARVACLLGLAACGPSPVAVCAGTHVGTFDGGDVGTLEATLDEKGNVDMILVAEASGTFDASGEVKRDGSVSAGGLVTIEGQLDLDTCDSEGTWSSRVGLDGAWSMALQ